MPVYNIIKADGGIDEREFKTPFSATLAALRKEMTTAGAMQATDAFMKDEKPVAVAEEATKTVAWLTGVDPKSTSDFPVVTLGKGAKPDAATGVSITLDRNGETKATVLKDFAGDSVSDLRKALVAAGALTDAEDLFDKASAVLPRRDEAKTKWKDIAKVEGTAFRIGVAQGKENKLSDPAPQKLPTETAVQSGSVGTGGGNTQIEHQRRTTLTPGSDALTLSGRNSYEKVSFWNMKHEDRLAWLRQMQLFSAMRVTESDVSLLDRPSFDVREPDSAISVYNSADTLLYRSTLNYSARQEMADQISENKSTLDVGGGYGGFSGSVGGSYGTSQSNTSDTLKEKLHCSHSMIIRTIVVCLDERRLVLSGEASNDLARLAAELRNPDTDLAVKAPHIFKWFARHGQYIALTVYFGAKLTYSDETDVIDKVEGSKYQREIEGHASASFGSFVSASGSHSDTQTSFKTTISTSRNSSIALRQTGGPLNSLGNPADFAGGMLDIDNSRRILGADLLPIVQIFPADERFLVMNTLAQVYDHFPHIVVSQPGNLPALVDWFRDEATSGL